MSTIEDRTVLSISAANRYSVDTLHRRHLDDADATMNSARSGIGRCFRAAAVQGVGGSRELDIMSETVIRFCSREPVIFCFFFFFFFFIFFFFLLQYTKREYRSVVGVGAVIVPVVENTCTLS